MTNHGHRKDGTPIADADAEARADEAGRGYDVDTFLRRRPGGRQPLGSAAAGAESVRLNPELKPALLIRAAEEHVSVSEVIRRAIGEYLRASWPGPGRGRTSQPQPARTGGMACRWLGQGCRTWTCSGCAAGAPSASPDTCVIRSGWNAMRDRYLTIVECRPPGRNDLGPEWTRFLIARPRYISTTRRWALYWRDRGLRFHRYDQLPTSPHGDDLLQEIDHDPIAIFWG